MRIVVFVELAVDPPVTKRRVYRFPFRQTGFARGLLPELQPRASGIGMLLLQPLFEALAIAKNQDRETAALLSHSN